MPIYEYQCGECGRRTEALQKISEAPLTDCPSCGRPALRKLISAAAFQLKGTGWYETDFKNKGREKPHAEGGDGKSEAAGGESKADATASAGKKKEGEAGASKSSSTSAAAD